MSVRLTPPANRCRAGPFGVVALTMPPTALSSALWSIMNGDAVTVVMTDVTTSPPQFLFSISDAGPDSVSYQVGARSRACGRGSFPSRDWNRCNSVVTRWWRWR